MAGTEAIFLQHGESDSQASKLSVEEIFLIADWSGLVVG
jgi:hypothetical protein